MNEAQWVKMKSMMIWMQAYIAVLRTFGLVPADTQPADMNEHMPKAAGETYADWPTTGNAHKPACTLTAHVHADEFQSDQYCYSLVSVKYTDNKCMSSILAEFLSRATRPDVDERACAA